jgi:hypothetical protein
MLIHRQIMIKENSTGYSYEKVFSPLFMNAYLDYIELDDPYKKQNTK